MAKGVKTISFSGSYYPDMTVPGKRVTLVGDKEVTFVVVDWYSGTTAEEKKKPVTWLVQDSKRQKVITKTVSSARKFKIPKHLCGGAHYFYIEASLSGNPDKQNTTGLFVKGHCPPLIINTKWSLKLGGADNRSRQFSFGENVFLGVSTEGINGSFVTVEVYRMNSEVTFEKIKNRITDKNYDATADDVLAKVFQKQAWVINGQINTDFTIQRTWGKGEDVTQFYIKIKDGKNYIKDDRGNIIHGRFLKVQNKTVPVKTNITTLNNNAPVKVGQTDKKVDSISTCKFQIIKFSERNKLVELFNEGQFINKMDPSSKFYTIRNINYDYDKSNIRADAKPVLAEVVQFLTKLMPYVPVELGSHTDSRGTDQYNMALSKRRAQSVVDYLVKNGVDERRIHAKGYGKTMPLHSGNNLTEGMHEQNRRTTIKFLISDKDALPIEYSLIAPDINHAKASALIINGVSRKGCYHKPEKHTLQVRVISGYTNGSPITLKEGNNSINYKVYSNEPKLGDFLHSFFLGSRFAHQFFINSCAYYSKMDKKEAKPTLVLNTYPDAVLTQNLRMSYKEPFFWNDVSVSLVDNFEWLDETVESVKKSITNLKEFSPKEVNELSDTIFEFLQEETHKFALGVHFIYNFGDIEKRKSPASTIDFTRDYRYLTAIALIIMYIIEIAIILLIIWFTRGKGAFGRIKKHRKFFKTIDKMGDWGFEIVYPKMAENRSMYFESTLGKISRVVEINSKADPLLGISYKKEVSLLEIEKIAAKLKKVLGEDVLKNTKLKFEFEGKIFAQFKVRANFGSKKIYVRDFISNLNSGEGKFTAGMGISAGASLKGFNLQKEKTIEFIPIYPPADLRIKLDAKLDVDLGGYMTYSRNYALDYNTKQEPTGIYYQDVIFFSGLKGTIHQRVATTMNGRNVFDTNKEDKPVPFTLLEGDTYYLDKVYIFKI